MKKGKLLRNAFVIVLIVWIVMLIKQQLNIMQYRDEIDVLASKIEIMRHVSGRKRAARLLGEKLVPQDPVKRDAGAVRRLEPSPRNASRNTRNAKRIFAFPTEARLLFRASFAF